MLDMQTLNYVVWNLTTGKSYDGYEHTCTFFLLQMDSETACLLGTLKKHPLITTSGNRITKREQENTK